MFQKHVVLAHWAFHRRQFFNEFLNLPHFGIQIIVPLIMLEHSSPFLKDSEYAR